MGRDTDRDGIRRCRFRSTRPHGARPEHVVVTVEQVSIHAPAWGATGGCRDQRPFTSFDPRARMGRDIALARLIGRSADVSIHAPAWGATRGRRDVRDDALFRSTRPHGARRADAWRTWTMGFDPRARMGRDVVHRDQARATRVFRSTRPHGARHRAHGKLGDQSQVSIHAPAWGATLQRSNFPSMVSIHAPAWGATAAGAGRDSAVSIHAPAWGATETFLRLDTVLFRSTRPHGARHASPDCAVSLIGFDPRARMGRDQSRLRAGALRRFRSTRPHGARPSCGYIRHLQLFRSTRPQGRDDRECLPYVYAMMFQSTRPHGARQTTRTGWRISMVSIHAPAWGATSSIARLWRPIRGFNPRAPHGARPFHFNSFCPNVLHR